MFQRVDSAFGRLTLGAAVLAVAVATAGGTAAADDPAVVSATGTVGEEMVAVGVPPVPPETGVVDGGVVAVGVPPVPPEMGVVDGGVVAVGVPPVPALPETGVADGGVVAVGLPPVPALPETGVVDGGVVAVGVPPVPAARPSGVAPAELDERDTRAPMLGRLRVSTVERQVTDAVTAATSMAALSVLTTGR